MAAFQTHLDAKDRAFSRFLLDLPAVPTDIMDLLRDLCVDSDRCVSLDILCRPLLTGFRMAAGFGTLREFVLQRPTLRDEALTVLLELTTHQGLSTLCYQGKTPNICLQKRSPEEQP